MVRLANLVEPARLKRSAIALLVITTAVLGALVVRATIAVEDARREVEDGLGALTGRPIHFTGTASAHLLPWPSVRFDDVTLSTADGDRTIARMDVLDVSLDVAALLLGRLRAEQIRLVRPDIRLEIGDPSVSAATAAARLAAWQPISLIIDKGRIVTALPTGDELFDVVDLRLSWPRPSANADLRAGFRWRGETVALEAESPSPRRLIEGGSGPAKLQLTSAPLRLAFVGTGGLLSPVRFDGTGDVDLVDAARFARWTGRPRTPDLVAGRLRLDGPLTIDADGATLPTARIDLAGNKAQGALTWRWDRPRPRLGGTIAFTGLDLTTPRRRPFGTGWRALPFDGAMHAHDFDLRLSSPSVDLPGLSLTRVAAAFHVAEGRLHAEIGDAELFGKPVSLVVRGGLENDGLRAQIRGAGDDLPLADLAALTETPGIDAGRASLAIEAETRCRDLGGCFAGLGGRLTVDARAITVTGVSPFSDISRFRPIVPQANGARVTTTWERAGVDLRLVGPRAEVDRVEILGQGARFVFAGSGDLATGAVDLTGHAYFPAFRPDPARTGSSEVAVPVRIGGTLRRLEAMARDLPPAPTVAP